MFSKNRNRRYTNGEITIFWQAEKCTHSTLCYSRLRAVFDPVRRPWINASGAPTADILNIIEECPSDALTFRWDDESRNNSERSKKLFRGDVELLFGAQKSPTPTSNQTNTSASTPTINEKKESTTKVDLRANGPIVISGDFDVIDSTGIKMGKMEMISLCRCGASGNMPYCDGTHFKIGFRA